MPSGVTVHAAVLGFVCLVLGVLGDDAVSAAVVWWWMRAGCVAEAPGRVFNGAARGRSNEKYE